ncbi:alpha/beta hydrolase fold [Rubrobacter xylanophilus DSM 9941]|uniref:Alpha/beta hydrolase fold n=1 Tax=Rubrobacter xylanophilus (strain DSM 9941 / JCM 11954 / NBRC 16129 / PRD-1) TaxID=266117 RepID=Q1B014_RUBXD|nr:alpha/beta fold hydrolase [Rubrobacter xylanophilus]ABG03014.1 alpha/beta hydrolase fold [Rubrobacter xylanophilus DSM 9941]
MSVRELHLRAGGVGVRCLAAGEGEPAAVLLHGASLDCADLSFGHLIGPLSGRRRVYAPDWPGYGGSERPPEAAYDLAYYERFLERLLDALGLERADLVGLSLGGGVALSLALREPRRVRRLVLAGSYGLGRRVPWGPLGAALGRSALAARLAYGLMRRSRPALRLGLRNVVCDPAAVTEELLEELARQAALPGAGRAFLAFRRSEVGWRGLRSDLSGDLHRLAVPTLLVHGSRDRIVPAGWAVEAHRRIPRSELLILEGCGHWVPRERPEEFSRAVERFLSRPDPAGRPR